MAIRQTLGVWQGVTLEVVGWDGVGAEVDLSVACMFTRELGAAGLQGGLAHLDAALAGELTAKRHAGLFRAAPAEILYLPSLPEGLHARSVLVVGMGDPAGWSPEVSGQAAATAARWALQHDVGSAAFAPSLLDSGLAPQASGDASPLMLSSVLDAIDAHRSAGRPLALHSWIFDAGVSHIDAVLKAYRASFAQLRPQASQ